MTNIWILSKITVAVSCRGMFYGEDKKPIIRR
jgi:hypothetical protein